MDEQEVENVQEQEENIKKEQQQKQLDLQKKIIEKEIKKKIIAKLIMMISGSLVPILIIFVVFIVVFLLIFSAAGLISFDSDDNSSFRSQECGFTISSTSLSEKEFKEKLEEYSKKNRGFEIFANNASGMYKYAKAKNINPELIPIRAFMETGGTAIPKPNNYWGMRCTNGQPSNCKSYGTFEEGYSDYVNNISQYDSLKSMMSKYAYIGNYWYNPGNWDLGGCAYAKYIFEDNMPDRVRRACDPSGPICTGVQSTCVKTTEEDQDAYANWQVKRMGEVRKDIFGLELDDGPCTTGNLTTLANYNLSRKGLKTLESPLSSSQINELNTYIKNEVNKAGHGTGAGVAAAGQALVYWLEQQGYYLNYYWGGGHGNPVGDANLIGASTEWGKNIGGNTYNPNQHYGMDCSGFVSWAIRNGCSVKYGARTTMYMEHGKSISVTSAKPGDLMLDKTHHVRLVVKNNGDGTVITAEETGGNNDWGLIFTKKSTEAGYSFIDMSDYYRKMCD